MRKPHGIGWLNMPGYIPATLNVTTGCTPVSRGCLSCYAERIHTLRHKAYLEGKLSACPQYAVPFEKVLLHPERLDIPQHWREPRFCFIDSMSDLFHEDVPFSFAELVMDMIDLAPRHIFVLLTKRPARMLEFCRWFDAPPNLWLGVSVESPGHLDRVARLLSIPAAKHIVSIEPCLAEIDITPLLWAYAPSTGSAPAHELDWVIIGGESGPNARLMNIEWARRVRDDCKEAGTPFFMKQMSGKAPIPDDLMIREWPELRQELEGDDERT